MPLVSIVFFDFNHEVTYVLNQRPLVLEGVTLGGLVERVVEVFVDLAVPSVLDEESPQDTETTHPENLRRHTSIGSTLAFTEASVTTGAFGGLESTGPRAGVHGDWLLDDQTIGDELADALA